MKTWMITAALLSSAMLNLAVADRAEAADRPQVPVFASRRDYVTTTDTTPLSGYGFRLVNMGSVDTDPFDDFVISAPFNYFGAPITTPSFVEMRSATNGQLLWRITGTVGTGFGTDIANVGDQNADGANDLLISDNPNLTRTQVQLYSGRTGQSMAAPFLLPTASGYYSSLTGIHDVDGDGKNDWMISDPQALSAFVYTSGTNRLFTTVSGADGINDRFALKIDALGDLNGDGIAEYGINATYTLRGALRGRLFIYSGRNFIPLATIDGQASNTSNFFAQNFCTLGDLNGDNRPEFAISNGYQFDNSTQTRLPGQVTIYDGRTFSRIRTITEWTFGLNTPGNMSTGFANRMACGGDFDGDGYNDLLVDQSNFQFSSNGTFEKAAVYVFSGKTGDIIDLIGIDALPGWTYGQYLNFVSLNDFMGDGFAKFVVAQPYNSTIANPQIPNVVSIRSSFGGQPYEVDLQRQTLSVYYYKGTVSGGQITDRLELSGPALQQADVVLSHRALPLPPTGAPIVVDRQSPLIPGVVSIPVTFDSNGLAYLPLSPLVSSQLVDPAKRQTFFVQTFSRDPATRRGLYSNGLEVTIRPAR